MLVLTRRSGQSIIIKDNIRITVISISNNNIKLGIEAPKDINVSGNQIIKTGGNIKKVKDQK